MEPLAALKPPFMNGGLPSSSAPNRSSGFTGGDHHTEDSE